VVFVCVSVVAVTVSSHRVEEYPHLTREGMAAKSMRDFPCGLRADDSCVSLKPLLRWHTTEVCPSRSSEAVAVAVGASLSPRVS
jgi:hypothetical protein